MIALVAQAQAQVAQAQAQAQVAYAALIALTGEKITFTLRHIYQRDRSSY